MRNNNREKDTQTATTGGRSITSDTRKLRRSNAAGKVLLAAIVHRHNYLEVETVHLPETGNQQQVNDEPAPSKEEPKADRSGAKLKRGRFGLLLKKAEEGASKATSKEDKQLGGCKFSRLFSKKKQTTTLIDGGAHLAKPVDAGRVTGEPVAAPEENAKLAAQRANGVTIKGNRLKDDDDYVDDHDDKLFLRDNKNKPPNAQVGGGGGFQMNETERVIEFKFDLIVECSNQQQQVNRQDKRNLINCDSVKRSKESAACSPMVVNGKLLDNVDELLQSFVLESADLCIMSTGKAASNLYPAAAANQVNKLSGETCKTRDEFDYLNQLVAHSLGRCFNLLNSSACEEDTKQRRASSRGQQSQPSGFIDYDDQQQQQVVGQLGGGDKFIEKNYYSIEISATLFLSEPPQIVEREQHSTLAGGSQTDKADKAGDTTATTKDKRTLPPTRTPTEKPTSAGRFTIVDLLLDAPQTGAYSTCSASSLMSMMMSTSGDSGELATTTTDNEGNQTSERGNQTTPTCLDCPNLETSLNVLNVIQTKLRLLEQDRSNLSFVGSNKLLLVSLKLKRKFNGGLFNNRMCLIDFDQNFLELHPIFECIFNGQALAYLKRRKLLHLNLIDQQQQSLLRGSAKASEETSAKAQLTTKQHHQVASNDDDDDDEKLMQAEWFLYKQLSSALIRTLIIVHVRKSASPSPGEADLAPFVRPTSEQKVATLDLERRLMEENLLLLEFARSIQRASATRLKRRKRHLKNHLISSNASIASNLSASSNLAACHNPLSRLPQEPLRGNADCCSSKTTTARQRSFLTGDRKLSLDANLAMARHHRKHHLEDDRLQQHYNQQQRHLLSMQHYRPHLASKQHSDFTESSSLSTSSGSQSKRARSARSSRAANHYNHHHHNHHDRFQESRLSAVSNNLSDSDSVTSANLNSCSSSSCNRLIGGSGGGASQRFSAKRSRHRRDVELRWMTKQFGRAAQNCLVNNSSQQQRGSIEQIELAALRESPVATSRRSSSVSRLLLTPPQQQPSNVIEIDCEPNQQGAQTDRGKRMSGRPGEQGQQQPGGSEETDDESEEGANLDNLSDVCSLVAEPPKQLRLEEFLSQLNCSMIAPRRSGNCDLQQASGGNLQTAGNHLIGTSQVVGMADNCNLSSADGRVSGDGAASSDTNSSAIQSRSFQPSAVRLISQNSLANNNNNSLNINDDNTQVDEDDEDCKSHSSILEHLSSLALESNSKLNSRQQSRRQQVCSISDSISQAQVCKESQQSSDQELDLNLILQSPIDGSLMFELGQPPNSQDGVRQQHGANNNNNDRPAATNTGHLQRLLNNSAQLRKVANSRVAVRDVSSIGHRLRALSISCQTGCSSASPSSSSSGTFISPDGSVCCSSSSSSNDTKLSDHQQNIDASQAALIAAGSDIHACVIRKVII